MASFVDKISKDFLSRSREEQERILIEDVGLPPGMARFRAAMLRGEIEGDAEITTSYVKKDYGRGLDKD